MKKIVSLCLVLVLCLGLAAPAMAAEFTFVSDSGMAFSLTNEIIGTTTWTSDSGSIYGRTMTAHIVPMDTLITLSEGQLVLWYTPPQKEGGNWQEFAYSGAAAGFTASFITGAYDEEDNYLGSTDKYDKVILYFYSSVLSSEVCFMGVAPETPSSWAVEQVNTAINAGIVPQSLQSKYKQATTRAEFCALAVALYETVKGTEITTRATFSDTTDVNVQKMASLGVVAGVGDGKFAPDRNLTREQAAAMLARLSSVLGKPISETSSNFNDKASISSWAQTAIGQMQTSGIMSGTSSNNFSPKKDYTREQSISTMLRLLDYVK